jgi:hypothetical protein
MRFVCSQAVRYILLCCGAGEQWAQAQEALQTCHKSEDAASCILGSSDRSMQCCALEATEAVIMPHGAALLVW